MAQISENQSKKSLVKRRPGVDLWWRFETGCRRVGKDQGAFGRIGEDDCG
jgi:hypothetical protein